MATALDEKDAAEKKKVPTDLEQTRKANLDMLNQQLILTRQQQIEALKRMHDAKAPEDQGPGWGGEGTIESNERDLVAMPDVRGQTESQAVGHIREAGLQPYLTYVTVKNPTSKYPIVRSVLPTTGTMVELGQTVTLTIEVPAEEEEDEEESEEQDEDEEEEQDERERARRPKRQKNREEELEKIQNEERVAAERQAARNAARSAASESGAAEGAAAVGEGAALAGEAAAVAGETAAVGEGAAVAVGAVATSEIWLTVLAVIGVIIGIVLAVILIIALFVGMCNMDGWTGKAARFGATVAHYFGFLPGDCGMVQFNQDVAQPLPNASGTRSTESDQSIRDVLAAFGITVNKDCLDRSTLPPGGQTCLVDMNQEVIDEAIRLRNDCTMWLGKRGGTGICEIVITGGTEAGHEPGQCSHENGFKMDIRPNPDLDSYIQTNFKSLPPRSGVDPVWYDAVTNTYFVREGDHWDTSVGCM